MRTEPARSLRLAALLVSAAVGSTACGVLGRSAPAPSPVAYGPPPASTQVGAPLPPGWVWPVNARTLQLGLSPNTVYRPVNMMVLRARAGTTRCAPVEVAPNVWVTPLCTKLPLLSAAPGVRAWSLAETNGEPPTAVDLRQLGLDGPVKDQQQAGVCWSFALSTAMENGLRRAGLTDAIAPLHLIADDEFVTLYQNGSGRPKVDEPFWPYDPKKACELDENPGDRSYCQDGYGVTAGSWRSDPPLVAERSRAEDSGRYRMIRMKTLDAGPSLPAQVAALLATGRAVFVGFDLDLRLWGAQRHKPGAVIPDWQPDGTSGHAVALVGYRSTPEGRQFLVHNSRSSSKPGPAISRDSRHRQREVECQEAARVVGVA
jgi:hypothetical protein